jgi:hypothetical protein
MPLLSLVVEPSGHRGIWKHIFGGNQVRADAALQNCGRFHESKFNLFEYIEVCYLQ